MANVKSCERNLQIPILKQILRQLPAQISKQNPEQNLRQNLKIPNLKKVIPLELIQRPPLPICFGYKSKKDECGICKRCFYNQEDKIKVLIQYSLDNNFYEDFETASLNCSCVAKTCFNKSHQTEYQFRKTQKKLLNQRVEEIIEDLKNL